MTPTLDSAALSAALSPSALSYELQLFLCQGRVQGRRAWAKRDDIAPKLALNALTQEKDAVVLRYLLRENTTWADSITGQALIGLKNQSPSVLSLAVRKKNAPDYWVKQVLEAGKVSISTMESLDESYWKSHQSTLTLLIDKAPTSHWVSFATSFEAQVAALKRGLNEDEFLEMLLLNDPSETEELLKFAESFENHYLHETLHDWIVLPEIDAEDWAARVCETARHTRDPKRLNFFVEAWRHKNNQGHAALESALLSNPSLPDEALEEMLFSVPKWMAQYHLHFALSRESLRSKVLKRIIDTYVKEVSYPGLNFKEDIASQIRGDEQHLFEILLKAPPPRARAALLNPLCSLETALKGRPADVWAAYHDPAAMLNFILEKVSQQELETMKGLEKGFLGTLEELIGTAKLL